MLPPSLAFSLFFMAVVTLLFGEFIAYLSGRSGWLTSGVNRYDHGVGMGCRDDGCGILGSEPGVIGSTGEGRPGIVRVSSVLHERH